MTGEGDKRRPSVLAFAAIALIVTLPAVPLLIGGHVGHGSLPDGAVRAEPRNSFAITAPLTLFANPAVVIDKGTVALSPAQSSSASTGKALLGLLTGGGADLSLEGASLRVGTAPGAESAVEALGPMATALVGLNFRKLSIKDATLVFAAPGGGEEKLSSLSAEVTSQRRGAFRMDGSFRLRGEEHVFAVEATPARGQKDAALPLKVTIKSQLLDLVLTGRYVAGDRPQLSAQRADLRVANVRETARWLGASWPSGPGLGAFDAKGLLTWSDDTISFEDASITLDGNAATGGLSIKFGPDRPSLEGTLAFESLNIGPYFPDQEAIGQDIIKADSFLSLIRFPGGASPSLIRQLDADLRISAQAVSLGGPALGRCAATLSIKEGRLFADLAELELDQGGTGDAQVTVDMTGDEPVYGLRGTFEDLDMARASEFHLGHAVFEGPGTVVVDLTGAGGSEEAVMATLSGKINIEMGQGARIGVDIEGLSQTARATPTAGGWGEAAKRTTAVDSLVARFDATNGVLTSEVLRAKTAEKSINGAGSIDVAERTLDLTVTSVGILTEAGLAQDDRSAVDAFRIIGRWEAPSIRGAAHPGKAELPGEQLPAADAPLPISLPGPGDRG